MAPHKFKSTTDRNMTNYKATPEQWKKVESWASVLSPISADSACILELRARVKQLETQANHIGNSNKMVPPPVATDEELDKIWNCEDTWKGFLRAIYDLGVAHGQASSRKVAEPAPVAGEMAELVADLRRMASQAFAACQFNDGETLTRAANTLQQLSEQEAGR
jgi:hypothetical protein